MFLMLAGVLGTALLVMDLQPGILGRYATTDEYLARVNRAIAAVTLVLMGLFLFLVSAMLRGRHRPVVTGRECLLGAVGISACSPSGSGIEINNLQFWRSSGARVPAIDSGSP